MNGASPAIPVRIIGDDELVQNGGQYLVEGRPAIPLLGGTAETINSGDATDGQVLTADGAGGADWETVSGGASVKLAQTPPLGGWRPSVKDVSTLLGGIPTTVDLSGYSAGATIAFLWMTLSHTSTGPETLAFAPSEESANLEVTVNPDFTLTGLFCMPLIDDAFVLTQDISEGEWFGTIRFVAAL